MTISERSKRKRARKIEKRKLKRILWWAKFGEHMAHELPWSRAQRERWPSINPRRVKHRNTAAKRLATKTKRLMRVLNRTGHPFGHLAGLERTVYDDIRITIDGKEVDA